jgi:hypothetical protein
MKETVSIATKPLVYQTFRYINNKAHYALAEYVDNSIASFQKHIDILKPINPNGKVTVKIEISDDFIRISDNAFGIEKECYSRAFELAAIPLDAKGLNEFGMGMKVSSIWFSNYWTVVSTAYGENVKKTFAFDLEDVVNGEKTMVDVDEEPCDESEHYTIVTLKKLSTNRPKQLATLKKHLTSIYTSFLREGILDLYINNEPQKFQELKVLKAPYYRNGSDNICWKKEIGFEAPKPNGDVYRVKGFVALLETMSTSENNGFLLFRRGRTIGTSGEDKYRPKALCGDVGSPRYKRVFGELEIEGFDVSFTKNSFNEDDQFQEFINCLADDLKRDKNFDIFGQAQYYTKPVEISKKSLPTISKSLSEKVNQHIEITTTPIVPPVQSAPAKPQQINIFTGVAEENKVITNTNATITIDGLHFNLRFQFIDDDKQQGLYSLKMEDEQHYVSDIYINGQYFKRFSELLNNEEWKNSLLNIVQTLIAAELKMNSNGNATQAKAFRDLFNNFLGKI